MDHPEPDTDLEDFLTNVDDVSMLIEGLKAGTISPEYIDRRQELKIAKSSAKVHAKPELPGKQREGQKQQQQQQQQNPTDQMPEQGSEEAEAKQARLMQKVEDLKASRALKFQARQRYEDYVQKKVTAGTVGTDYTKWDMWCPEDEEDEMFNSLTPPDCKAMEKDINDRHKRMVEQRQVAERYRVAGNEAFRTGQYSEALRCYQLGVDAERTNISLHANAAQAALKISCYVQAVEHCDKAIRIAEFLHNNTQLPVCTKVYVRRAAAYRALDQLEKAESDLELALKIEPDNKDVLQLLAKARRDLAEQRKQKEVCKALAGAGPIGESECSSAFASDVSGLRKMEQLVQQLLPPVARPALSLQQQKGQQGGQDYQQRGQGYPGAQAQLQQQQQLPDEQQWQQQQQLPDEQQQRQQLPDEQQQQQLPDEQQHKDQRKVGGLGPKLPAPPKRAAKGAGAPANGGDADAAASSLPLQLDAAAELLQLLKASTACCVYFRVCGGLKAAASVLASLVPRAQQEQQQQQQLCVLTLDLLHQAVDNDGNLFQLASEPGLFASGLSHLHSPHAAASKAAAQLLYSISTHEDARKLLSKHLGRKEELLPLVALLRKAPMQLQGRALALLSNCMVESSCKVALQQVLEEDQQGSNDCAACLQQLAASPSPFVAEHALNLVGNMCGSTQLRAALHSAPQMVSTVIEAVVKSNSSSSQSMQGAAAQAVLAPADQVSLCVAASTALYNLVIDAPVQEALANSRRLAHLLGGLKHGDARVVARLAGVVARCAKHPRAASLLLEMRAGTALCGLLERALTQQGIGIVDVPQQQQLQLQLVSKQVQQLLQHPFSEHMQAVDAAVRALAVLTSGDQVGMIVFEELLKGGLLQLLQRILTADCAVTTDALLGNAALCLGHVAARPSLLPALRAATQPPAQGGNDEPRGAPSVAEAQADLVAALLRVASTKGAGTASRNAGIALARMALDPQMLLRLKEMRGLEIIHATARP